MIEGILLKGYGGFYYVYGDERVWECSLRGRFRVKEQNFLPGDRVKIAVKDETKGTVEAALPRRNYLIRPAIANVDQVFLVFALTTPKPDMNLLDRLLIQVLAEKIEPVLVFTKLDKVEEHREEGGASGLAIPEIYREIGFEVCVISNKTGQGVETVAAHLKNKISVLAGPSGAGKSSLCNVLLPGMKLKTGELSAKAKRGRHTTRHIELMLCSGGFVADTPGFSSLFLPKMKREELSGYFPEFGPFGRRCRFSSCLHAKEPDCAVKEALENKEIFHLRYAHYLTFLQEISEAERRY